MLNIPEWPLYLLAGVQSVKYVWRFWQTHTQPLVPTNFILLGKAFSWTILCGVYIWVAVSDTNILIERSVVRLGNILWIITDLIYFTITIMETRRKHG